MRAGRAVLAIGGAAKGRRGPLRDRLTVASSHIVLTEPVPELLEQVGWDRRRVHHRLPRPARLLPHHPGRPHRLRLGRRPDRDGGEDEGPRRGRRRGDRGDRRAPLRLLPGPGGKAHHPRLGRPDRRLPDPPAGGPLAAARPRLRRRRLHRQRRRPLEHGRPHAGRAGPRPPRRPHQPRLRRRRHPPRPPRALPLDRRRSNPPRNPSQGGGRDGRPHPRQDRLSRGRRSRS